MQSSGLSGGNFVRPEKEFPFASANARRAEISFRDEARLLVSSDFPSGRRIVTLEPHPRFVRLCLFMMIRANQQGAGAVGDFRLLLMASVRTRRNSFSWAGSGTQSNAPRRSVSR